MDTALKTVFTKMVECFQRMILLKGIYKNFEVNRLKLKKLDCLLTEAELIIEELEQYEKQAMEQYEKDILGDMI